MDYLQFSLDVILILIYSFGLILVLAYIWRFWMLYINQAHLNDLEWIMLEIKLPREISKSPAAFEMVATALLQSGGVSSWWKLYWSGNLPIYFSLEIASLEGEIHFYIRTRKGFKTLLEANLYAQYPGIEIVEAEDYTGKLRHHHLSADTSMWGNSFILSNKFATEDDDPKEKDDDGKPKKYTMPGDFKPIRTYVDIGLDKDPKEEFKNDPLTTVLEFLGGIGKGQYAAMQLLVQDQSKYNDDAFPKTYLNEVSHKHFSLSDLAKARILQIRGIRKIKKGEPVLDEFGYAKTRMESYQEKNAEGIMETKKREVDTVYAKDTTSAPKDEQKLTMEERSEIELINRKMGKPLARCVLRTIYVAKADAFAGDRVVGHLSLMKPFSYPGYNSLVPKIVTDPYDYPWQDTMKKRKPWRREEFFDAFVEREGFFAHSGALDLGAAEDVFFFPWSGYIRRTVHMILESLFKPFSHPKTEEVFTLNVEEIATLYHFPGATASVPTLPRIDSLKGVAPTNLPQ